MNCYWPSLPCVLQFQWYFIIKTVEVCVLDGMMMVFCLLAVKLILAGLSVVE